jgi:hypothetical protein
MKKILFIAILFTCSIGFAQQNQSGKTFNEHSIKNLTSYPNPFSVSTKISFQTEKNQIVILVVKNILGRTVFSNEYKISTGNVSIPFYKNHLKSGTYFYSIITDKETISKRLIVK